MTLHTAAAQGFQVAADAYERGRPDYPAEAVSHLVSTLEIAPGQTVVDVGAGTGKFTQLLLSTEAHLVAVEPVEGMRTKFASLLPTVPLREGSAERIPLPDASAHAVVAAQAFHWFDGPRALHEIRRVLKPHGRLGLIWNARDESVEWVARLTEIIDRHEGGAPRYRSGHWRKAFDESPLFTPLSAAQFRYVQRGTYETIVDRVTSISFVAALPASERERVAEQVRRLLASHPLTRNKAELELPYRTDVFWCARA